MAAPFHSWQMIQGNDTHQKPGFSLAGHEVAWVKTRFLQQGCIVAIQVQ
jgi:hypothetical protein